MPVSVNISNINAAPSTARVAVTTVAISDPASDGAKRVLQPGESVELEVPKGSFLIIDEDTKEP